jgi:hypothetical protein
MADRGAAPVGASAPWPRHHRASYSLRECSRALLAGSKPALASGSQVVAGGDHWLFEVPEASMSAAAAMRLTQLHGEPKSTLVGPSARQRRHGGAVLRWPDQTPHNGWTVARPIFQGCPSVAGVVRRRGSSIGSSHTEPRSIVCHLVKAWPMSYGSRSRPTGRTTSTLGNSGWTPCTPR